MEDTDFNAELMYIAKDIRKIHREALDLRGDFRLNLSLTKALEYQVIIEKLALALIATNRYDKKGKVLCSNCKKELEENVNFVKELKNLSEVQYKNESGENKTPTELLAEFNKLFPIHDALIFAIAKENLFKKKLQEGQEV